MTLDPKIWGPHYWFVLHTIALSFCKPNETIRKKFYDFYQNLPLFLPIEEIGNNFSVFRQVSCYTLFRIQLIFSKMDSFHS